MHALGDYLQVFTLGASPSRALLQSRAMVGTPRPVHSPVRPPPAEFQPPREGYSVKYGHMNDAYIERGDCSLITKILDGKLNVSDAFDVLKSADLKDAFLFLKSNRGSRYVFTGEGGVLISNVCPLTHSF